VSVAEMARAARARGYQYLAICDHTPAVGAVRGLTPDDVRRQGEEIAAANAELAPFRVLRGIECDILPDGRLDLPDDVLAELEWVQASVHGGQRGSREELTKRVLTALDSPYVSCLSHPTGRLINHRPPNAVDLEAVFTRLAEQGRTDSLTGLPNRRSLMTGPAMTVSTVITTAKTAPKPAARRRITAAIRCSVTTATRRPISCSSGRNAPGPRVNRIVQTTLSSANCAWSSDRAAMARYP